MKKYYEMTAYKMAVAVGRLVKINKVRSWCARIIIACIEKDAKAGAVA